MKKITSAFLVYLLLAHSAFALSLSGDDWKNPLRTKTWTPPSVSDTLAGLTATQSFQNKTFDRSLNSITNLNITNTDVSSSAAIAYSKLASLLTGQVLCGNAGTPTACTMSGGASIGATGIVTLNNSSVITQLLTGYTPGAGTVSSSDSILQAIQKVDGNDQLKVAKSVATTAGDLYGSSASSTPARVPVGNDGDVLSGDSSQSNKWTTRQILESTNDLSQFNGYENLNTWATGNNATVMGGGTLNGVFAKETVDPLNLSATYKYTQGASALNDYMCTPAKPVKRGFKGPTVFVGTPFNYDGSSGDIQASVYDVTNSAILNTFSTVSIPSSSSSPTQMMSGVFPSSTNSYRICYQVKTANSGKIFSFGPIKSTKSLADFGNIAPYSGYDWAPCSFSTLSWQGLGTVSNLLECKRQGESLKIRGSFTAGTVSANLAQMPLPTNYGAITTSPTISTGQTYGTLFRAIAANSTFINTVAGPSLNYISFSGNVVSAAVNPAVAVNGNGFVGTGEAVLISGELTIPIAQWGGSGSAIASPTQQISSDTINFTFKSTAIVDSDPIGTYNTYSYAINSNASTICATAPTQTASDMNANGVRVYARAYNTAGTCANPSKIEIKLDKNLKSVPVMAYGSTGKSTSADFSIFLPNSSQQYGVRKSYSQASGVLLLDSGVMFQGATNTAAFIGVTAASGSVTDGYFVINGSTTPSVTSIPSLKQKIAYISDVKTSGTNGGSASAATWNVRTLNTINDPYGIVSAFASNRYTLLPGRYDITIVAPAYRVAGHKVRMRNVTDSTTELTGTSGYSISSADTADSKSIIEGQIVITSAKQYELQHYTTSARANDGLGTPASSGESEVYTTVRIEKLEDL